LTSSLTGEALARADMRLTLGYWPWSLLAQPEPLPEQMITASADAVVNHALQGWGSDRNSFPPDVRNAYIEQLRDLPTVHAICEEYRAAATLDFTQDTEVLIPGEAAHDSGMMPPAIPR